MFAFKPIAQESLPDSTSFISSFQENVEAVEEFGVDDLAGFLFFHIAFKVLNPTPLVVRTKSVCRTKKFQKCYSLLLFVRQRCEILENLQSHAKVEWAEKNVGKGPPVLSSFMTVRQV